MKCPYCQEEMIQGYIYGDRYPLKWLPTTQKLILGIWAKGGVKLGHDGSWSRFRVNASSCSKCQKMIIDYSSL